MGNEDLRKLFLKFDNCSLCKTSNNKLHHILGGGQFINPKVAFVFINPTHTNISSHPSYQGRRFPFIGVTHFWQILADSGWLPKETIEEIKKDGWNSRAVKSLEGKLRARGVYITNLVKCTFSHADYPEKEVFDYHLPLFKEELKMVKPKSIVSFGALTTKYLTGKNILLKEYFKNPKPLKTTNSFSGPVYPCWFPVGRGNAKLASKVLRELRFLLE